MSRQSTAIPLEILAIYVSRIVTNLTNATNWEQQSSAANRLENVPGSRWPKLQPSLIETGCEHQVEARYGKQFQQLAVDNPKTIVVAAVYLLVSVIGINWFTTFVPVCLSRPKPRPKPRAWMSCS